MRVTGAVKAALSVEVFVEPFTAEFTVCAVGVITAVDAVSSVTSATEQILVEVALVRLTAAVAR